MIILESNIEEGLDRESIRYETITISNDVSNHDELTKVKQGDIKKHDGLFDNISQIQTKRKNQIKEICNEHKDCFKRVSCFEHFIS